MNGINLRITEHGTWGNYIVEFETLGGYPPFRLTEQYRMVKYGLDALADLMVDNERTYSVLLTSNPIGSRPSMRVNRNPATARGGREYLTTCAICHYQGWHDSLRHAMTRAVEHAFCPDCLDHCGCYCPICRAHDEDYCVDCNTHAGCAYCYNCEGCCHNYCDECGGCCEHYCEDCRRHCYEDADEFDYDTVHGYSYTPELVFWPQRPLERHESKVHIGMELEVSWEDRAGGEDWLKRHVDTRDDFWYAKEDSSVYRGFEVVTHPFLPRWALEGGFPFASLEDGRRLGAYDDSSCGTHIHIEKAALTGRQVWTLFKVHDTLRDLCGKVGGRGTANEWARWEDDRILDKPLPYKLGKAHSMGRYVPVNAQPGAATIELRYPRGGFSTKEVKKNIQWVEALLSFGADKRAVEFEITEAAMLRHIERNDWTELQEHLAEAGY